MGRPEVPPKCPKYSADTRGSARRPRAASGALSLCGASAGGSPRTTPRTRSPCSYPRDKACEETARGQPGRSAGRTRVSRELRVETARPGGGARGILTVRPEPRPRATRLRRRCRRGHPDPEGGQVPGGPTMPEPRSPSLVQVHEKHHVVPEAGQPVGGGHGDDEGEHVVNEGVESLRAAAAAGVRPGPLGAPPGAGSHPGCWCPGPTARHPASGHGHSAGETEGHFDCVPTPSTGADARPGPCAEALGGHVVPAPVQGWPWWPGPRLGPPDARPLR